MKTTYQKAEYVIFIFVVLAMLFPLATTYHGRSHDVKPAVIRTKELLSLADTQKVDEYGEKLHSMLDGTGFAWSGAKKQASLPL
jgi:hypothetical protein